MKLRAHVFFTALGASSLAIALFASAQAQPTTAPSTRPTIDGEWQLAISDDQARQRIERAIETATDGMPPIADGMAASRLRERTPIIERVVITSTPQRIRVHLDERRYETAPGHPEAAPTASTSEDTVRVVHHFREGALEQVFTTDRGRRWNTFTLGEDGRTMTLNVVVQSSSLPAQLRFTLPYRRVS
ncbi:hypothetical protein [Sandaracinus amylolyticus]|uniref:hypothetical protein n=1 Tax=Sandaracinus amylolyticus TaxID=927083 RepID=UPI001F366F81|nr:hypothetical protein [Sandaracinus amylolyticus]UJR84905.1 Hypothetical protein I5071_69840 [Sandaracinus amylolyticus]